ncbi:helix-turn-helix transcriptional regulator [Tahibacter harae]|uniref:Response regulator transcription factor n=1 Tax=Tahibacter harae TaxID=2963937 RepID=A0ABT1QWW6_9GAMM|nr:response regulator transcription factor [Tahibacter harae]MCQ4166764.1 response regulator transcription factor [Tahibacter harae]
MRSLTTVRLLLGYGGLAALVLACLWLVSLAPLRLGWGRELVGAAIATVALCVGLHLARKPQVPAPAAQPPVAISAAEPQDSAEPEAVPVAPPDATGVPPLSGSAAGAAGTASQLSQREREVLHWLAQGLSNKEIARTLSLSENTVKTHLANVYAKLGVGRRTEALKVARQQGLA